MLHEVDLGFARHATINFRLETQPKIDILAAGIVRITTAS